MRLQLTLLVGLPDLKEPAAPTLRNTGKWGWVVAHFSRVTGGALEPPPWEKAPIPWCSACVGLTVTLVFVQEEAGGSQQGRQCRQHHRRNASGRLHGPLHQEPLPRPEGRQTRGLGRLAPWDGWVEATSAAGRPGGSWRPLLGWGQWVEEWAAGAFGVASGRAEAGVQGRGDCLGGWEEEIALKGGEATPAVLGGGWFGTAWG